MLTNILAVTLFGSRARGDAKQSSDIDILLITDGGKPRHTSMGNISMSFYPLKDLRARSRSGNLFLCHVLREGKPVFDPDGLFASLSSSFNLRPSYEKHIRQAAAVGWLLVRFGEGWPDKALVRRRIAWTVRSILIGRSAEAGTPVFSSDTLALLGPKQLTRRLIQAKDAARLSKEMLRDLEDFLNALDLPPPLSIDASTSDYADLFANTGNEVGKHFLQRRDNASRNGTYS